MKRFRLLTFVLLACFLLAQGCTSKKKLDVQNNTSDFYSLSVSKGKATIIEGLIKNREVYPHVKTVVLEIPDFAGYNTKYTSIIEEDGSFRFKIFPITAREISLKPVSDVVVVHPGDSIYIEKDFKDIGSVSFSGDAASLNSNINKFLNGSYLGRYTQSKDNLDPESYKQYCINYKKEAAEKLNYFIKDNSPPEDFIKWANTTINFDYYSALLHYLMFKKLTSKERVEYKKEYYDFIEDINSSFNNSVITSNHFQLTNNFYNDFLAPSIITKYPPTKSRDHQRDSMYIEEIGAFSKNNILNQFVVSHFFNGLLKNHSIDLFEENSSAIAKTVKEPILLSTLLERYQYVKDYATNPKPLSEAMLGNTDFNLISNGPLSNLNIRKNLINRIISNNRSKVIYIDFWAVWCPPCLPEMEASKRLMESLKGENVEFIYICLSDSISSKEHIKQIGLGGTHYYLNLDENIFFQNNFGFQSIPHYILIDSTGVIVDFGSYIRPSNPVTLQRIKKLLK